MAQTSTTLSGERSHKADVTGTDISFNATGATYKITSTSTALDNFAVRDLITVSGTTNNNSTFTVCMSKLKVFLDILFMNHFCCDFR